MSLGLIKNRTVTRTEKGKHNATHS